MCLSRANVMCVALSLFVKRRTPPSMLSNCLRLT